MLSTPAACCFRKEIMYKYFLYLEGPISRRFNDNTRCLALTPQPPNCSREDQNLSTLWRQFIERQNTPETLLLFCHIYDYIFVTQLHFSQKPLELLVYFHCVGFLQGIINRFGLFCANTYIYCFYYCIQPLTWYCTCMYSTACLTFTVFKYNILYTYVRCSQHSDQKCNLFQLMVLVVHSNWACS